jgi:hypothetical protein
MTEYVLIRTRSIGIIAIATMVESYLSRKTRELVVVKVLRDDDGRESIGVLHDKHIALGSPASSKNIWDRNIWEPNSLGKKYRKQCHKQGRKSKVF